METKVAYEVETVVLDGEGFRVSLPVAQAIRRHIYRRQMREDLGSLVRMYYQRRELKWPTMMEALGFAATEMGEAWELVLERVGGWVRNNPHNKAAYDGGLLARELGQAMMMLQVAGMSAGVDPMAALREMLMGEEEVPGDG